MAATKERLLKQDDANTRIVQLGEEFGDVVIRRLKLKERNELVSSTNGKDADMQKGLTLTKMLIVKALVEPALTPEEVEELPIVVADAISNAIMHFNGWTKEGQAEIRDHFRAPSGS